MVAHQPATRDRPAGTAVHVGLDRSAGIRRVGYPYLLRLRRRWQVGTAEVRLLGRRTTVLSGPEGVQLFYDDALMRRRDAVPRRLLRTLFGAGAVHGLDDDEHKHRKAMFVRLLTPDAARDVASFAEQLWQDRLQDGAFDPVGVFDESVGVHCAAACRWAGVPPAAVDGRLGQDLAAIVDGFGSLGPRGLRARRARRRVDKWARRLIVRTRGGLRDVEPGSALDVIAAACGTNGALLPARVAGVELVNILRPTVAVAYFVAFAAHALQTQPQLRHDLRGADDTEYEAFAHEIRRYYPFVPMLAARVRRPVTFQGRRLEPGQRVVLDVYGTLHDPDLWEAPETFDLARFRDQPVPDYYVPQGGGDVTQGHRCPGESVAIELIKVAARYLVSAREPMTAPTRMPMNRLPTRPLSAQPAHKE